jgi:hypothetical protein
MHQIEGIRHKQHYQNCNWTHCYKIYKSHNEQESTLKRLWNTVNESWYHILLDYCRWFILLGTCLQHLPSLLLAVAWFSPLHFSLFWQQAHPCIAVAYYQYLPPFFNPVAFVLLGLRFGQSAVDSLELKLVSVGKEMPISRIVIAVPNTTVVLLD